jgi:two-component system heavy metal sensor histidine kinase CusS
MYIEYTVDRHFEEMDAHDLDLAYKTIDENLIETINQFELKLMLDSMLSVRKNIFAYLEDRQGNKIYASGDMSDRLITFIAKNPTDEDMRMWYDGSDYYRILIAPANSGKLVGKIAVGMNINFHQNYLLDFRINLWVAAIMAYIMTITVLFISAHYALKPIDTISKKIQNITSKRLHTRLDSGIAPTELKSLIVSFNAMIENIEEMFKKQSNFSADIAHELRTPIANLITQIQIMLNKARTSEEYKEILYSNLEELERMSKTVNDMLFLVRCENGEHLHVEEVDLNREVLSLIEYFGILAEDRDIKLIVEGSAPHISANKQMAQRAIGNLLSNAVSYADDNTEIVVKLSEELNYSVLSVSNKTKMILSQENINRLFDRFYRIDAARERKSGGIGIGLAIVKSIMQAHRGLVTADYNNAHITFSLKFIHNAQK